MARFKLYLEQGSTSDDIEDLLEAHEAEVVKVDLCDLTVDVPDEKAEAFSYDAENDFNVSCIDEVK